MKRFSLWTFCLSVWVPLAHLCGQERTKPTIGLVQFVYVTPGYSNAEFRTLLSYFNAFAKKVKLDIPLPLSHSQIREFRVDPTAGIVGARLILTNDFNLWFGNGVVEGCWHP